MNDCRQTLLECLPQAVQEVHVKSSYEKKLKLSKYFVTKSLADISHAGLEPLGAVQSGKTLHHNAYCDLYCL